MKNSSSLVTKTDFKIDPLTDLIVPDVIKTNTANEIRAVFQKYDMKGNLLSFSKANGMTTCYIWSYNDQYPVAEIKNADYALVETVLGKSNIDNFVNSVSGKTDIDSFVAPLRTSFPNAQITVYTYKPLIGILSVRDPKGMTINYEYDELHRLKTIKDQNGNIVKSYNYHYSGQ